MITKYDMSSGAIISQSKEEVTTTSIPLIEPYASLQLVTPTSEPEPQIMPPDLAVSAIQEFLKQQ